MKLFLRNSKRFRNLDLIKKDVTNSKIKKIDVTKSGTRKEELLVSKDDLSKMWILRKILMPMGVNDSMEFLIDKIKGSKNNSDFLNQ